MLIKRLTEEGDGSQSNTYFIIRAKIQISSLAIRLLSVAFSLSRVGCAQFVDPVWTIRRSFPSPPSLCSRELSPSGVVVGRKAC